LHPKSDTPEATDSSVHSTRLDLFDNSDFHPGSILKRLLWALLSGLFFQNWIPWPSQLKSTLLRIFGAQIGEGLILKPRVTIKYPWKLRIRDHVWIGENVWIDNLAEISIGSHVCISQGALLLCGNHDFKKSTFDLITRPIDLEDGVWIGAKCVVAPGVTCRSHSVLSLGSVATKDLKAWTVYQGNPATAKKPRSQNS
jgi:putative colanic acid biosynthesis acetyltransferase WcaF